MHRRGVLTSLGSGIAALTGCTGLGPVTTTEVAERPMPSRPSDFTRASVAAYVSAYESARVHNKHAAAGATDVSVETTTRVDYETAGGVHVTVQHAGTVRHGQADAEQDRPLHSSPTPYRVTPTETLRYDRDHERVLHDDSMSTDGQTSSPLGVRVLNDSDRKQDLTVWVDSVADSSDRVSECTVTIHPTTAVVLKSMAHSPGAYQVTGRFEENGLTAQTRLAVELPGLDRAANLDVRSGPDGVSAHELPEFDPV